MKMLIFGATGRVGQVLSHAAGEAGWELLTPSRGQCNLLHPTEVADYVLNSDAAAVVNCAAMARLEECEDEALNAHLVNAVSPAHMALACRHTGARFIHLSTDYVLEGKRPGLKDETTRCKPVNTYGMSKLEGECEVAETNDEALILRVSWVCGNPQRPGFVESSLQRALDGAPLAAVADQYSLPTHARDIARVILNMTPLNVTGVWHLTSTGEPVSRLRCVQIALEHAVTLGVLRETPPVDAQRLSEVKFFRALRPVHTAMDNRKLQELGVIMPGVEECIRRAVENFFGHCA